ncbi:MAG: hypothetical protein IKX59_03580 [Bacteroidales bacterium]|nr:hypothetical protein [Bacteroidales bacterium]
MKQAQTTIQELLKGRNADFDASKRIKLVRHVSNHNVIGMKYSGTVLDLYNDRPLFLKYQQHQRRVNFEGVEYFVSFISKGADSLFVGVFKNNGETPEPAAKSNECYFDFQEVSGFDDIKEKVIIEWHNPRAWHQWYYNQMKVIAIDNSNSRKSPSSSSRFQQFKLNTNNRTKHIEESTIEVAALHQKMQEGIKLCLEAEGFTDVIMEADHIDIQAKKNGLVYIFEVKTYDTARACIREALGQILEYNHFPLGNRADKMYIVGPVQPLQEELQYIDYLRTYYNMNITYRCYSENDITI